MTALRAYRVAAVRLRAAILISAASGMLFQAFATERADMAFWISMRGITEDAQPSFVIASYASSGNYTTPIVGCHGHTYYLRSGDATVVQTARDSGDTVQIHTGEPGTAPQDADVVCLIQIDH